MKKIDIYISEKLKISTKGEEIDFDRFAEEFRIYAKNVSHTLDLKQFNLNVEYHHTELYIFDSLIYSEREDKIYIRAHNKYNTKHVQLFNLSSMYTWINYFVLGLNLPHRKNEETALKQIKEVTLYLQSKDPESMMSEYEPEFM
jgi:hypothetical protein